MPRSFPVPGTRRITQKQMPFRSFTPEVRRMLIRLVKDGEFITSACRKARIGEQTLRHWLTLGEAANTLIAEAEIKGEDPPELTAQEEEFRQFYLDVYEAEGHNEGEAAKEVRDAGRQGNWVASITFLERRHGQRWKKREQTEHVGPGGGPIQTEQLDNSAGNLAEILTILQTAGALPRGTAKELPAASDV